MSVDDLYGETEQSQTPGDLIDDDLQQVGSAIQVLVRAANTNDEISWEACNQEAAELIEDIVDVESFASASHEERVFAAWFVASGAAADDELPTLPLSDIRGPSETDIDDLTRFQKHARAVETTVRQAYHTADDSDEMVDRAGDIAEDIENAVLLEQQPKLLVVPLIGWGIILGEGSSELA